jgi:hypothetical protein
MSGVTADKLTEGHEHWMELNGLVVIEPQSGLAASIMKAVIPQANVAFKSRKGSVHGMHFQYPATVRECFREVG